MALDLHIKEEENGAVTVHCSGRLIAGVTDVLYREVKEVMQRGRLILLDLTELTQMDSMGLGTIIRLRVSARANGAELEVINFSKQIRELFGITGLLSMFETCGAQRMRMP